MSMNEFVFALEICPSWIAWKFMNPIRVLENQMFHEIPIDSIASTIAAIIQMCLFVILQVINLVFEELFDVY